MNSNLNESVHNIICEISRTLVMPKFRNLKTSEIHQKAADDIVTDIDHAVEQALEKLLPDLIPDSRVIGEEGVAANSALLDSISDGWVWLVDPIDGTRNFADGSEHFAIMIALLFNGDTKASWIYSPAHDSMAYAAQGAGAYVDGKKIVLMQDSEEHTPVGNVHLRFVPATWAQTIHNNAQGKATLLPPCGSAGATYPMLLQRLTNFIVYWRTLPWDQVAGILLITEAGGKVARFDGTPYCVNDKNAFGLIVASNEKTWNAVHSLIPQHP